MKVARHENEIYSALVQIMRIIEYITLELFSVKF